MFLMLILSRKKRERIVIGASNEDVVIIEVIQIRGCRVLLGVEAPEGVRVRRAELTGEPWRRRPEGRMPEARVSEVGGSEVSNPESQRPAGQKAEISKP
jgi:carbon storage regulator CsrA